METGMSPFFLALTLSDIALETININVTEAFYWRIVTIAQEVVLSNRGRLRQAHALSYTVSILMWMKFVLGR